MEIYISYKRLNDGKPLVARTRKECLRYVEAIHTLYNSSDVSLDCLLSIEMLCTYKGVNFTDKVTISLDASMDILRDIIIRMGL